MTKPLMLIASLLLASGCASVDAKMAFNEVSQTVQERTGKRVHWNQGTPADQAVEDEVSSLLREKLSAEAAVQVALLNNRDLQATYEELKIAQADLVAAGLLSNPIFDTEIRFPTQGGRAGLEMTVVQDFLDVFFIPLRKAVAQSAFDAAKLSVARAAIDLARRVRVSFYTAQASEQVLEMRRSVVTATEAGYILAKKLREAGNITDLELSNERALFEQAKLDQRSAEVEMLLNRERLNSLLGLWGEQTQWTMEERLPHPPAAPVDADGLERRAVERSLDLGIAKNEIEQTTRELGIVRPFALFPGAEVGVTTEREAEGDWALGPILSLPLPLFNQGQPAVASAQAALKSLIERYRAKAITLRSQVRAAHATVTAARERVEYYAKVMLPLREQIVNQTQLQYNAMQVGAFQLLQAKRDQIDAASDYIGALLAYWLAHTELQHLLSGRMTAFEEMIDINGGSSSSEPSSSGANH